MFVDVFAKKIVLDWILPLKPSLGYMDEELRNRAALGAGGLSHPFAGEIT